MATYASTLIIKDKLNCSESDFLKKLNLDKPRYNSDNHTIGKADTSYNDALAQLKSGEVFVAYYKEFTVVVSLNLVFDFMFNGLLINSAKQLFPESEMFLFFHNSTSNLGGFAYLKNGVFKRKKCVEGGKVKMNDGHFLDEGELLEEECSAYSMEGIKTGEIRESREYLNSFCDFEIGVDVLESKFFKENPIAVFDSMILNPGFDTSISSEYMKLVNKKVEISNIDELVLDALGPILKKHVFKSFKSFKKFDEIKRNFIKKIDDEIFVFLAFRIRQMFKRSSCYIAMGFADNKIIKNFTSEAFLSRTSTESVTPVFSINSRELLKNEVNKYGQIFNWNDLERFVQLLPKEIEKLEKELNDI